MTLTGKNRLLLKALKSAFSLATVLGLAVLASPSWAISTRTLITATGVAPGDQLGNSVSAAGDLNGDGYPDVIVGAYLASSNAGAAYIYFGGPGAHSTPDVTLTGEASNDYFAISVLLRAM